MKKIMFLTSDNTHIIGYTEYPIPEEILENSYVFEVEDEVLEEYMHYKVVDGKLVRMEDAEYNKLYPEVSPEPTEQEQINATLMLEIAKLKAKTGGDGNA